MFDRIFLSITSSSEDQLNKGFQHLFWKGAKENLNLLTTDLILIPRLRMEGALSQCSRYFQSILHGHRNISSFPNYTRQQSPASAANNNSASRKSPRLLWNPSFTTMLKEPTNGPYPELDESNLHFY